MKKITKAIIAGIVSFTCLVPTFATETTTPTTGTVNVLYYDLVSDSKIKNSDGTATDETKKIAFNTATDITAKTIEGYKVWGNKSVSVELNATENKKTIRFNCYKETPDPADSYKGILSQYFVVDTEDTAKTIMIKAPVVSQIDNVFAASEEIPQIDGYTFSDVSYELGVDQSNRTFKCIYKYKPTGELLAQGSITYKCFDENGTLLHIDKQASDFMAMECVAPDLSDAKCSLATGQPKSKTVYVTQTDPNKIVDFTYKYNGTTTLPTKGKVTYNYVDSETKNIITTDVIADLDFGVEYSTAEPKAVPDGYALANTFNPEEFILTAFNAEKTVTIECVKSSTPPTPTTKGTIKVIYFDTTNNVEISNETLEFNVGSHTISGKEISGYTLVDSAKTVDIQEGANPQITFNYTKNSTPPVVTTGTVTIISYDVTNQKEISRKDVEKTFGTFTVSAEAINGYTIQGDMEKSVTISKDSPNATVTFNYIANPVNPPKVTGKVIINYLLKDNNSKIAESKVLENVEAGTHSYDAITVDGYTLADSASKSVTISDAIREVEINFMYTKNGTVNPPSQDTVTGTITVSYKDVNGNALAPSDTYTNLALGNYSYTAKVFNGYSIVGSSTASISLTEANTRKDISFTYKKNSVPGSINIIYVNEETGETLKTGMSYSDLSYGSYTYAAEKLSGYKLTSANSQTVMLSEGAPSATIIFNYKSTNTNESKEDKAAKIGKVTIKYIDEATGNEIEDSKVFEELELKKYTYSAIEVKGYILSDDVDKIIELTKDKPSAEIVFKYKASTRNNTTSNSQVSTTKASVDNTLNDYSNTSSQGMSKILKIGICALVAIIIFILVLAVSSRKGKDSGVDYTEEDDSDDNE